MDHIPIMATSYNLDQNPQQNAIYSNNFGTAFEYRTDSLRKGLLAISELNKASRVISGTFSFSAYNKNENKSKSITSGKFRIHYTIS